MKPLSIMLIAGEASGDLLGAELVEALRVELAAAAAQPTADVQPLRTSLAPRFFGAGGPRLAAAGVELAVDLTAHAVIGLGDVLRKYAFFRAVKNQLLDLAIARQPDAVVCVDFSGFNRRFGHALKQHVRARSSWFHAWNPKLVQFVSPQVWASRPSRAEKMARDFDLLLSIFPFEKDWYAKRTPGFHVEFVGHPMVDRHGAHDPGHGAEARSPLVVLLPGSRVGELKRHLPPMLGAWRQLRAARPDLRARMVLPKEELVTLARQFGGLDGIEIQLGRLPDALRAATLALASTGTVTLECAWFGVPTVAFYKTSWSTYQVARRIVTVTSLTMPNLLAGETVFPEFVQHDVTADNLARAAGELLDSPERRAQIRGRLAEIVGTLGPPGAARRAARCITELLFKSPRP